MADIIFVGKFTASKIGKTGLTPTVDVSRYTLSDGTRSTIVTAGSATEGIRGLYHYRLAAADLATYQYVATFITTDATVDLQESDAIGLVVPDALTSSRLAPTDAGRTLDIAATGEASVNVTYSAGIALTGRLAQVTDLLAIGGTSTYSYSNTVDDGSGNLLDGVFIQCATDAAFTNIVSTATTNSLGAFTVYDDVAGTHYLRLQFSGITFTDQTVTLA